MTLILSNEEIEKLLDVTDCIDALEDAYREQAAGRAISQLRMDTEFPIESNDQVKEFEFKTIVTIPGFPEPINAGEGRFVFKSMLHRIIATVDSDMPSQSGDITVTSSIRRVGREHWISQQYRIPVERIDPGANQPKLPMSDG